MFGMVRKTGALRGARAPAALAAVFAATGCGGELPSPDHDGPLAAVSVVPQAWLVERIGGPRVRAVTLVEPGASPATYQPTDAQVSLVMRADVYFRIGVPFERGAWFEACQSSGRVPVVDLRRGIELRAIDGGHDHASAATDPHIWLSPALLAIQARTVTDALSDLDPEGASGYRRNLAELEGELARLDAHLRTTLAPVAGRRFFVLHPAWGYFADAYGLREIPIEIAGRQPSDSEMTALLRTARQAGADVIFAPPQLSPRTTAAVAAAVGGRIEMLDPLAFDVVANLRQAAEAIARVARPARDGQTPLPRPAASPTTP